MANRVSVELNANVKGFVDGMNQASESAKQYETDQRKVADSAINFKKELGALRKEVMNLAGGYARLDDAAKNSDFGRQMKKQLDTAKKSLADMVDMQGDLNQEIKNMASDTRGFDTAIEGLGVLGNTISAAASTVATFTGNEEDARKAVTLFTGVTSALSAAQKIQNALQSQSNTMLAITTLQTKAAEAAEKARTSTIVGSTVAQKAFNAVAKANPYVLLATGIIAVVAALKTYIYFSNEAEKQERKNYDGIKMTKAAQEEFHDAVQKEVGETMYKYNMLQTTWKSLRTEAEKTKWLKDNKDAFKDLGIEVNNVKDAENVLVNNTQLVVKAFMDRAKAAAYAAQAKANYEKILADTNDGDYDYSKVAEDLKKAGIEIQRSQIHHGQSDDGGLFGLPDVLGLGYRIKLTKEQNKKYQDYLIKQAEENSKQYMEASVKFNKEADELIAKAGGGKSTKDTKDAKQQKELVGLIEKAQKKVNDIQEKIKHAKTEDDIKDLNDQLKDANKELERLQNIGKEIAKPGSLEYINKQISEIDSKLAKLDPRIDFVKIDELKIERDALEQAKKDVESSMKEVTILGKSFETKGSAGSLQEASDKVSYYKTRLDVSTVGSDDYNYLMKKLKQWEHKEEQLKLKIDADMSNTTKGSLEWLGKEKQKYQAIIETAVVGSDEWYEALDKVNELTKQEQKIEMQIDISGMSALEKVQSAFDGLRSIDNVVSSFESLTSAVEEGANAWEIFIAVISTVEAIIEGINTVTQICNILTGLSAAAKTTEAAASGASTTATATEAATETAAVAPATALIAANKLAAASYLELASAQIFAAHAAIPFAGPGIAAGLIATMLSVQAAAKATAMALAAFENGGIVGGNSYHGDRIMARVNSGEMILNQRQQKNLFDMLDSNAMPGSGGSIVQVQGVVSGTDLLLVQKNTNKVRRRTGTQITF